MQKTVSQQEKQQPLLIESGRIIKVDYFNQVSNLVNRQGCNLSKILFLIFDPGHRIVVTIRKPIQDIQSNLSDLMTWQCHYTNSRKLSAEDFGVVFLPC